MLGLAIRQKTPYLLRLTFHDDQKVSPSVVAKDTAVVLFGAIIGM